MRTSFELTIDGRVVGPSHPPYVIAELSGNHNGDIDRAFQIMAAAKQAGVDAVKLQTYTADTLTIDCDRSDFQIVGGPWNGVRLYDLYREASTPWEWHEALFAKGAELGLAVFSSPFDDTAVDFLEELGCPAYKIASFEAVDIPLIRKAAGTGKPLIISTGMVDQVEIEDAVCAAKEAGASSVSLLHCVSAYPAKPAESNLRSIPELGARFGTVAGLSDHTLGTSVSVAAVALGASIIEKHVTLKRSDGGPDAGFSLEPDELSRLVTECRTAWEALGNVRIGRQIAAKNSMVFRRSLYVVENVAKGEPFTMQNVRSIRPGHGLPPKCLADVIGGKATKDIIRGTPLDWSLVEV